MVMSGRVTKAMVLAAGEGTRLRPLTTDMPKVLLPVSGVPLLEHIVIWLKSHGIAEVAINLYHQGKKIRDFVQDGSRLGVKIIYSPEETMLGTAGGVKRVEHFFNGTFVVVYGDILTDFDLSSMISLHQQKKAIATIVLLKVPNPSEVGIAEIDGDGKLVSFVEKPPPSSEPGNLASGGVYVLEKEILDYIPNQGFCDFAYDVFPKIIRFGLPVYGYCLTPEDHLLDIGTPEKYHQANKGWKVRYGK